MERVANVKNTTSLMCQIESAYGKAMRHKRKDSLCNRRKAIVGNGARKVNIQDGVVKMRTKQVTALHTDAFGIFLHSGMAQRCIRPGSAMILLAIYEAHLG